MEFDHEHPIFSHTNRGVAHKVVLIPTPKQGNAVLTHSGDENGTQAAPIRNSTALAWEQEWKKFENRVKLFTNLYPNDGPQLSTRFELVYQQNKWHTVNLAGTQRRTASGKYNFVTLAGKIYLHRYGSHVDIANGDPVQYAGEVQFSGRTNRGQLR